MVTMRAVRIWVFATLIALLLIVGVTGSAYAREDVFTLNPGVNHIEYPHTDARIAKVTITMLETNLPATPMRIAVYLINTGMSPGSEYLGYHDFTGAGDAHDYYPINPSPGNISLTVTNSANTNVVIKLEVEAYGG